jgi:hypothetical protein
VLSFPPQAGGSDWSLFISDAAESSQCDSFAFYCSGVIAQLNGIAFGDVIECVGQVRPFPLLSHLASLSSPCSPPLHSSPALLPAEQHAGQCGLCVQCFPGAGRL